MSLLSILTTAFASGHETSRASVDSFGMEGNSNVYGDQIAVSEDGTVVVFASSASNVVVGDTNGVQDVFVHDRTTGITERVSVSSTGAEGNGFSSAPTVSSDGQIIAFHSGATNFVSGDSNGTADVFVHDRSAHTTESVSVDVFGTFGNRQSTFPSISADGNLIVFNSEASNLDPLDTNTSFDVYLRDRLARTTARVSVSTTGGVTNDACSLGMISADGFVVAFQGRASNLVSGDTNGCMDVFVRDLMAGSTQRVSINSSGVQGNGDSYDPVLSADGAYIAFTSVASNLVTVDLNGADDVFVRDRGASKTKRVSISSSGSGAALGAGRPSISDDGQRIAFLSESKNLVSGDTNNQVDVFVRDITANTTERVSVDSAGNESNGECRDDLEISADGVVIAYCSHASNLVPGDANGFIDVFVYDRCPDATWSHYGAGFPGTLGIPAILPKAPPVIGTTLDVDIGNSSPSATLAVLLVGDQSTSIPLRKGGDLLVVAQVAIALSLPPGGMTVSADIDNDPLLCGLTMYVQSLLVDPGAAKGQAASCGLKLVVGD